MRRSTGARRLMLLLLVLALGGLWYFHLHPLRFQASEDAVAGKAVSLRESADLLLLIDHEVVAAAGRAHSFQQLDLSYGWLNLAEQEVGRFAVVGPGDIRLNALDGRRVVVVTRSAMRAAELWLPQLKLFVEDGGVLVLERPTSRWDFIAGVEVVGNDGQPLRELTGLRMSEVRELTSMPWHTEMQPLKVVRSDVEVLAEAGGQPVIVRRMLGQGAVIVLALDVGRQITALQQGTPAAGSLALEERYPRLLQPGLHTDDMVADARMLTASVPYADVFEHFIMALIDQVAPLPRWWAFPEAAPGAYLSTQDEGGMGDRAGWMAEAEREQGLAGTCFIAMSTRLSPLGMERFAPPTGGGCALGLSWNLSAAERGLYRRSGFWRFQPIRQQLSLQDQAEWFTRLTERRVLFSRTYGLEWESGWTAPFHKLAAAGVTLDSSYGPAGTRGQGYLFGTGLPFRVLDASGMPLGELRELPFHASFEGRHLARETLERLLLQSAEIYHEPIVSRLSPAGFAAEPDVELYRMWKDSFATARKLGLWITDMQQYQGFISARLEGVLSSTFRNGMLLATAQAVAEGQTLALPAQWSGRPAGPVTVDGSEAHPIRLRAVGGDLLLLPLKRGTHSVALEYVELP